MTITKSTTQIPDWFDLSNYSECKNLSKADWHRQLYYRTSIIAELEVNGECDESLWLLKEIRKFGLPDEQWSEKYTTPSDPDYLADLEQDKVMNQRMEQYSIHYELKRPGVIPIPVSMMAVYGESAASKFDEILLARQSEEVNRIMSAEPYDSFRARHDDDGFETKAFLMIDLAMPDAELIAQFKSFLPGYRKFLGVESIKKRPSESVIGKLANYRVLPYLDLYIWEIEQDIKLKRSVFAGSLFPNHEMGEIELNQMIKPLAIEVVSDAFLKMLKKA